MPGFRGCRSIDQMAAEPTLKRGESIVVNYTDLTTGKGAQHWVCAYRTKEGMQFFDSFGSEPSPTLLNWLRQAGRRIRYNTVDIQSFDSVACGWYCIHVLRQLAEGRSLEDVCDDFAAFHTWDLDVVRGNDERLAKMLAE